MAAQSDDTLLSHKLDDLLYREEGGFLGFLDERQRGFLLSRLQRLPHNYLFYGGYHDAQRTLLGIFPVMEEVRETAFPLSVIRARFRKEDSLSHRDFLGSLMGLQIKREAVGDIFTAEGEAYFAVKSELAEYILSNLDRIGRCGVLLERVPLNPPGMAQKTEELSGVVASLRLDCIVALLCKTGRSGACDLIRGKKCFVNHIEMDDPSKRLNPGDTLSVRGVGKFLLQDDIRETQKGRIRIPFLKYL